jgi:hypothetical protein
MSELLQVIIVTLVAVTALAALVWSYWKPAKPAKGGSPMPCAHCSTQAAHRRTAERLAQRAGTAHR